MPLRRLTAVLAATVLGTALFTACAPNSSGSFDDPPKGVTISVYQPRPDIPKNRIAIEVHNDGKLPVTITSASLHSNFFADDFIWGPGRTATIAPGYAVDLRVDIPEVAACDEDTAENGVAFFWKVGDETGNSLVEPDDGFHMLDRVHDEACLVVHVEKIATLTAVSLTAPAQEPAPAELLISVEPTGEPGTVTIDKISSTTLLNPAGPDGIGVNQLPLGIAIGAEGPPGIRVPIVPNRCDPHALAEDKIGTRMPLYVTLPDGSTGRLVLAASDQLRTQMYQFFSDFCGL
ncbi:MAG TPA: hypothetical protein VGO65_10395 [Pseudolysinimonas sp.]|jgi:hypothetical protein|nr:hypothetical protein [Pseudolysinimonas sp.]